MVRQGYLTAQKLAEFLQERHRDQVLPGIDVGKYRLKRQIGRGGMGVVYEAEDTELHRSVALKLIRESDAEATLIARLHREASIMAQLRHPNVVAVHEVGCGRDPSGHPVHFIAMDYVPGPTLEIVLADSKVTLAEKLRIIEEVARATAYAHAHGILHRDLKPANVLVDADGRPLLTDFGLARVHQSETRLTQSTEILGTPAYMAPEQVQGRSSDIDARTDVYALGVVLYQALTGRLPFQGSTPEKLYFQILMRDPVPPTRVRRETPRDLEVICLKALRKQRGARYVGAREFAEDLARYRRGDPILARPPSLFYRVWRGVSRRQALAAVAIAVLLVAATTFFLLDAARRNADVRERMERGTSHEGQGRMAEAIAAYQSALDLNPGYAPALAGLERARRRLDSEQRAREEALRLVEQARPALVEAHQALYRKETKYADVDVRVGKAQTLLERAIQAAPGLAVAHYLLGQCWEHLGWWERAEASWKRAIELDPKFGPAYYCLGRLFLSQSFTTTLVGTSEDGKITVETAEGRAWEGLQAIDMALREGSGFDDEMQKVIATGMLAYCRIEPMKVLEIAHEGIRRYEGRPGVEEFYYLDSLGHSDPKGCIEALNRALEIRPKFPLALDRRGLYHERVGNPDAAIADYSAAIELHPRYVDAYNNRGVLRKKMRDFEAALSDFSKALEIQPRFVPALVNTAGVHQTRGDLEAAIRTLSAAIEIAPRYVTAYLGRGLVYAKKRDWDSAIADYSQAIDLDSKNGSAYRKRGHSQREKGNLAAAVEDFSRAIAINSGDADAYIGRGLAYHLQKVPDAAIADFTEAIRIDPNNREAHLSRGLAFQSLNRYEDSISDFTRAIEIGPPTEMLHMNRGLAYFSRARLEEAIQDFTRAIDLAPRHGTPY